MIKIAIIGPESSGKTTLSKELAEHFQVKWHAEYAREYLTKSNGKYTESDLLKIAQTQNDIRSNSDNTDNIAIYDTENTVIKVWSEYKYNHVSPEIVKFQENQKYDHYFLCSPDGITKRVWDIMVGIIIYYGNYKSNIVQEREAEKSCYYCCFIMVLQIIIGNGG